MTTQAKFWVSSRPSILFQIPPEIRQYIWVLAMPSSETYFIRQVDGKSQVLILPPLVSVCRQSRTESASLFFHGNKFVVEADVSASITDCLACAWLLSLLPEHYAAIRELTLKLKIVQQARFAPRFGIALPYRADITISTTWQKDGTTEINTTILPYGNVEPLERLELRRIAAQVNKAVYVRGSTPATLSDSIVNVKKYYSQWTKALPSRNDMRSAETWLGMLEAHISRGDEDMKECLHRRLRLVRTAIDILSWT
ncbi:hypothetical protein BDV97DRAFT_370577 [Delphinella strobiligena]|nr:hypothetical protein BDV97DRAFT_370577 [Delphinella strobiligena]